MTVVALIISRYQDGQWVVVGTGTWDGYEIECDAPLSDEIYDTITEGIRRGVSSDQFKRHHDGYTYRYSIEE